MKLERAQWQNKWNNTIGYDIILPMTMRTNFDGKLGEEYDQANTAHIRNQQWYPAPVGIGSEQIGTVVDQVVSANLLAAFAAWKEAGFTLPFNFPIGRTPELDSVGVWEISLDLFGDSKQPYAHAVTRETRGIVHDGRNDTIANAIAELLAKENE